MPDAAVSSLGTNSAHAFLLAPRRPRSRRPRRRPTPTPTPTLDAPKAGEVNVLPVKGKVKIKLKGAKKFVDLTQGLQVKAGAAVDTRNGTVDDRRPGQERQGGLLRRPLQDQPVQGAHDADADREARLPARRRPATAAKKPKTRKLWGDGKGKFRTKGKYSAATVRGTKWLVTDTCTRRRRRSRRASSTCEDFVKQKTVILRKGKHLHGRARSSARSACVSGGPLRHFG